MNTQNYYENVDHVISISTNIKTNCQHCNYSMLDADFTESINHYIKEHGYKILHIGTETSHGNDNKPWHDTVALLGINTE